MNKSVRYSPRKVLAGRCQGFSLIELLVVIAIMVILGSLYSHSSSGRRRHAAMMACQDNLRKLSICLQLYARENSGSYPRVSGAATAEEALDLLIPKYTVDTRVFVCPASKDAALPSGESVRRRKISYAYYSGRRSEAAPQALVTDRQVDTRPKKAGEAAFSTTGKPPGDNHGRDGGNLLFTDGEVRSSPGRLTVALDFPPEVSCLNPRP